MTKRLFRLRIFLVLPLVWFYLGAHTTHAEATFTGVGDLPGGKFESVVIDVSADGSTVVGYSNSTPTNSNPASGIRAIIWTESQGIQPLGDLFGGEDTRGAYAVSSDGSVVVGVSNSGAFRQVLPGVMMDLGVGGEAWGVSGDGAVVVGQGVSVQNNFQGAFRWTAATGPTGLGGSNSIARAVSSDGTTVVGGSSNQAFRWTQAESLVSLGDLPGGEISSEAFGVSADGNVIVGSGTSVNGVEAFRWTASSGMVPLGDLPGGFFQSRARDVSDDGSIVVGWSHSASPIARKAFIWDATNGMRELQEVLETEHGLDLTGWTLTQAFGVSGDGLTIVGVGRHPTGEFEGWVARLIRPPPPEPPVVLVHGWCGSAAGSDGTFETGTFGQTGNFLQGEGRSVHYFDYSSDDSPFSPYERRDLFALAAELGKFIDDAGEPVDVIAHSMGGLLARAWMAGLTDGIPDVPIYSDQIRKLVLAGTPNFGIGFDTLGSTPFLCSGENDISVKNAQLEQMLYGSEFLEKLNNRWAEKISEGQIIPQNILIVIGCGIPLDRPCRRDGIVRAASAALPVESDDYWLEYVDKVHAGPIDSIVFIDTKTHETYELVKRFIGIDDSQFEVPRVHSDPDRSIAIFQLVEKADFFAVLEAEETLEFPSFVESLLDDTTDVDGGKFFNKQPTVHDSSDPTGWWTVFLNQEQSGTRNLRPNLDDKRHYEVEFIDSNSLFLSFEMEPGRPTVAAPVDVAVNSKKSLPDLSIGNIAFCNGSASVCDSAGNDPLIMMPGDDFELAYQISYIIEGGKTRKSSTSFYISRDPQRGSADISLVVSVDVGSDVFEAPAFDPISKRTWKETATNILVRFSGIDFAPPPMIPIDPQPPPGLYYLLVCGDHFNDVPETIGSNNCQAADRQIDLRPVE